MTGNRIAGGTFHRACSGIHCITLHYRSYVTTSSPRGEINEDSINGPYETPFSKAIRKRGGSRTTIRGYCKKTYFEGRCMIRRACLTKTRQRSGRRTRCVNGIGVGVCYELAFSFSFRRATPLGMKSKTRLTGLNKSPLLPNISLVRCSVPWNRSRLDNSLSVTIGLHGGMALNDVAITDGTFS